MYYLSGANAIRTRINVFVVKWVLFSRGQFLMYMQPNGKKYAFSREIVAVGNVVKGEV